MRALLLTLVFWASSAVAQEADLHRDHVMAAPAQEEADPSSIQAPLGTDQTPGTSSAPPRHFNRAADRYYDPEAMDEAERSMMADHGEPLNGRIVFNLAEVEMRRGKDGYRWNAEAWLGNIDRFVFKSEGEGTLRGELGNAELQALYARALDPWWNLMAGIRQDVGREPGRNYAVLGIEGRAPYQFDVGASIFMSGEALFRARLEGYYDQRITQRLILQPRAELNFAVQDMPSDRLGPGLNDVEFGLRLRYEVRREFAPYVGLSQTWLVGRTGDYAVASGHPRRERSFVVGVRAWF